MLRSYLSPSVLVLACLAALPALAATPIEQTRPLDPRGRVEVENVKGRVEVRTWDRPEVKITGSLGDGVEKLLVEGDARALSIEVKYPRNARRAEPTTLVLQVPRQAALEIETVLADIDVQGTAAGELSLESVSGSVVAIGAPRRAKVESVSGDLNLNLNSGDVEAGTVSGELALRGRLDGVVSVETVSGNLRLDSRGERLRKLDVATVSGDADVRVALAEDGKIEMESVSGDLLLVLPKSVSASVEGESFSGSLRAPDATIRREKFGPGSSFNARYGNGRGEIRMETFSGDAELRLD